MFSKEKAEAFCHATYNYQNFLNVLQDGINIGIEGEINYNKKAHEVRKAIVALKRRLENRKIKEDGFLYVGTEEKEFEKIENTFKAGEYLYNEIEYLKEFRELVSKTSINFETNALIRVYEEIMQ